MAIQPPIGVEVSEEISNFFRSDEWIHYVSQRWTRYVTDRNRLRPHHAQPAWGFPQMTWLQYLAGFNDAQYSRRFNPNVQQAPSLPGE
ncbi:hypothetical protein FRC04_012225 [Tulasnella sp. 424]|nr:hypothetical protein FRC04_012225 [Tulasnella sp. 424]